MDNFTIQSASAEDTVELGRIMGTLLGPGDVVALVGNLGSGKTWFTKGIAKGLGVPPGVVVTSPSFALVNEYGGEVILYHMDIYRLENEAEFFSAGLEEYLYDHGIAAVEWADRFPGILPDHSIRVELAFLDDHRRQIVLSGSHPRAEQIIRSFRKGVEKG